MLETLSSLIGSCKPAGLLSCFVVVGVYRVAHRSPNSTSISISYAQDTRKYEPKITRTDTT
jgi:hypothetical protein